MVFVTNVFLNIFGRVDVVMFICERCGALAERDDDFCVHSESFFCPKYIVEDICYDCSDLPDVMCRGCNLCDGGKVIYHV